MTSLENLILASKQANSSLMTIEATVDTGFEQIAEQECRDKFGPELLLHRCRGRVYFNVDESQYSSIQKLRSVNNLSFLVNYFPNVGFRTSCEENHKEFNIELIHQLTDKIVWEPYLNAWKNITDFNGILYPTKEQYLIATSKSEFDIDIDENAKKNCVNQVYDDNSILRFRVTCYRSGQHSFGSQDAARYFGGPLQDRFHWIVNLSNFHLEIILAIRDDTIRVLLAITESSLHNRNLSYFGITTLRSTISFNLLQVARPVFGDIVMDPLCGSGSIPMEGASGIDGNFYLCGDNQEKLISLTRLNKSMFYEKHGKNLLIDPLIWDTCLLPLRNSSIDVVATDLPFGKRVGSKFNNRTLYPSLLKELARVVRPITGRIVLLTTDRRAYNLSLQQNKIYWKQMKQMVVKIGGLKACVYLLHRTCNTFK